VLAAAELGPMGCPPLFMVIGDVELLRDEECIILESSLLMDSIFCGGVRKEWRECVCSEISIDAACFSPF